MTIHDDGNDDDDNHEQIKNNVIPRAGFHTLSHPLCQTLIINHDRHFPRNETQFHDRFVLKARFL